MSAYPTPALLIHGRWLAGEGRDIEPVLNPATEQKLADLPHATAEDLDRALQSGQAALPGWASAPAHQRSAVLRRAAALMRERLESIATILTLEQGKTLFESRAEVAIAAEMFDWMAEEGRRAYGRVVPARQPGHVQLVLKEPVGVVAAFTPWNFPAMMPARKIAAALAAGCPCILKPSEETPGTALEVARCLMDAGLPHGVLNVVFGVPSVVSRHLLASDVARKVSFTGPVAVGKQLGALAAARMKRITLELGGHAPVLVFEDTDVSSVVTQSLANKFRNAGQTCIAPTRFFVHEAIYEQFVSEFTEAAEAICVGDGLSSDTTMGPLANPRRVTSMTQLLADAQAKGAKILTGGGPIDRPGFFWKPTVVANVPRDAGLMQDEPFGPVAVMTPFQNEYDAISRANALPFALAAYAFTRDGARQSRLYNSLESGLVGINTYQVASPETPFGGIKDSGNGVEGGSEGLDAYLTIKLVAQSNLQ